LQNYGETEKIITMKRRDFIQQSTGAVIFASMAPARSFFAGAHFSNRDGRHICIFSKHLQWLDCREMAQLASEMGFTGIDLTVRSGGHVLPENARNDLPRAVALIREAGLEVPMITTEITDPHDPYTLDILETAGKLGIKLYRPGWYRYGNGVNVKESIQHARRQLSELQKINRVNNIAASYQNHAGTFVGSSGWDLMQVIDGLDPRWVGVQFDIRHATVEGPESWPVVLELLAPYINSVDIKDYTWETTDRARMVSVPLGEGLVEFDTFLEMLQQLQVRTDFSIHCEYPLGGAEHGARELGITREAFREQVGADLAYFKGLLNN
jgi:sugar phosphate isomerase/epimerase